MIDREAFYLALQPTPLQRDGLAFLLDEWEARAAPRYTRERDEPDQGNDDVRQLAYALAVAHWGTGGSMQPVAELPAEASSDLTGQTYEARGYVPFRGIVAYDRLSMLAGRDLVSYPALALQPDIAATILFDGLERGVFTGLALWHFINGMTCDFERAWQIVSDEEVAGLSVVAHEFAASLGAETPA